MKRKTETKNKKGTFSFLAPLSLVEGNYVEHAIFLPIEIIEQLPAKRLRAKGAVNGEPFALAIQYRKSGDRFFMINKRLVKSAKLREGLSATVEFTLVDPDFVEVPEELEAVLAQDAHAKKVWETFTNGLRRSLIHYVTSAKNIDVRIKRSIELMEKAKRGVLTIQQRKNNN